MKTFIPCERLSKRERRVCDAQRRVSWGAQVKMKKK